MKISSILLLQYALFALADANNASELNNGVDEAGAAGSTSEDSFEETVDITDDQEYTFKPSGGGDPHFSTFDGTHYSYHGECDLVMARSPSFGDNLGLDLHIRTHSMGSWSVISNAAVRIGDDVFELQNDASHYVNGHQLELPYFMAGRYPVSKKVDDFEKINVNGETEHIERQVIRIDLGNDDEIKMTLVKGMIYVRVNAYLEGTEGMLGVHEIEGLVGRDRKVLDDPNDMGSEWQVRETEPLLFREIRFPQPPHKCQTPDTDENLVDPSNEDIERAQKACANVDAYSFHFCLEDILATGDLRVADHYLFGEEF